MPDERPGLFIRLRGHLSLSRVQATLGIIAALLSIGGFLYAHFRPGKTVPADQGEIVAFVEDRSGKPVSDAIVELLTPKDALVTTVPSTGGQGHRQIKEGSYKLRVTHPRYATEVRQLQVVAGQTSEIRVRLAPRAPAAATPMSPAERAVNEGVEGLKKIFR
jgi:hypothetical protein